jgi:hypothetical protein
MQDDNNIFLSYSRSDYLIAMKIVSGLSNNGLRIWVDQINISPGAIWDQEIEKALEKYDCLIFLLSATSVSSNNVLNEVYFAIESNKFIIPIKISDCKVPFRLRRFQFIDFSDDYEKGFQRLLQILTNHQKKENQNEDLTKGEKSEIFTLSEKNLQIAQNTNKGLVTDDKFISKPEEVKKVLCCSGRLYNHLVKEQAEKKRMDIAVLKINQLYPVPIKEIEELYIKYQLATWYLVQEEPANLGFAPLFRQSIRKINFYIISRPPNIPITEISNDELKELIKVSYEI